MVDAPPPAFSVFAEESEPALITVEAAPSYLYKDLWTNWEIVDQALHRVTEAGEALGELEPELITKIKEAKDAKAKSSKLYAALHDKSRSAIPNALKRIRSGSSTKEAESNQLAQQEFEAAHRDDTMAALQVEELRGRVNDLKGQMRKDISLAATTDQVFELLAAYVAGRSESSAARGGAEERLAITSTRYELAQNALTDLTRARVTVQHAHHYYTTVLKIIDSIRGSKLGRAALGGLGEMSKKVDYQVSVDTASKAQVCFNETVRVLGPHVDILPPEILADFDALKVLGLLQASKIYGLLYGFEWKTSGSGVKKSVELMLQKQEDVFARLTRLAVWIQDRVPACETQLRTSRASRDQARRELVAAWKSLADRVDPAAHP